MSTFLKYLCVLICFLGVFISFQMHIINLKQEKLVLKEFSNTLPYFLPNIYENYLLSTNFDIDTIENLQLLSLPRNNDRFLLYDNNNYYTIDNSQLITSLNINGVIVDRAFGYYIRQIEKYKFELMSEKNNNSIVNFDALATIITSKNEISYLELIDKRLTLVKYNFIAKEKQYVTEIEEAFDIPPKLIHIPAQRIIVVLMQPFSAYGPSNLYIIDYENSTKKLITRMNLKFKVNNASNLFEICGDSYISNEYESTIPTEIYDFLGKRIYQVSNCPDMGIVVSFSPVSQNSFLYFSNDGNLTQIWIDSNKQITYYTPENCFFPTYFGFNDDESQIIYVCKKHAYITDVLPFNLDKTNLIHWRKLSFEIDNYFLKYYRYN